MKKAKIYKPSKTAMQSGLKKFDKWIIEFITEDPGKNPLMGWESSSDTYSELNLEFKSKDLAIEYAKKNNILFENIDSTSAEFIRTQISASINTFEPRVNLLRVRVTPYYDENAMNVSIQYEIIGIDVPAQQLDFVLQPTR